MPLNKRYSIHQQAKSATVKQPKELTSYSRHMDNTITLDNSTLKYYYFQDRLLSSTQGVNLGAGFKQFKENPVEDFGNVTHLLTSIESYERANEKKVDASIITWRGLMRQLMCLPYDNRDKIVYNIVPFDGQFFIQVDVPTARAQRAEQEAQSNEHHKKLQYSGYKFETLTTLDKPWVEASREDIEKRHTLVVNNIEQYSSVVSVQFGKTKLVLGAEVDCVWDYKPSSSETTGDDDDVLSHYVELKTSGIIDEPRKFNTFEKKLLKSWSQCFLVGIPKLIYGFRDDNLILRSIEEYQVDKVPVLLKNNSFVKAQNPKPKNKCMHCLKFFIGLIDWVSETLEGADETTTFRLIFDPNAEEKGIIQLVENTPEASAELLKDAEDGGLISKSFKDWRKELKESPAASTSS
ncbi:unnamed protein product [Ambrosiozyma monospora]|uniref:Unnamed protein product n=1 Tax=Ambrosiozyma monospora TaxID=43982 RepID=A0ACB5TB42_AMBMO|nr:unnamed protein product [Ambrosiozyma monospora]